MGHKELLADTSFQEETKKTFQSHNVIYISTSGEFADLYISDQAAVATAIRLERTKISVYIENALEHNSSEDLGRALSKQVKLNKELKYLMLLTDGGEVNGTGILNGIENYIPSDILITGGMAGDMYEFQSTLTGYNDQLGKGNCILIAFYNKDLKVTHGSFGGWQNFGPLKTVTKSSGNVLRRIDDLNALDLYKKYLGPYANELPGSALLFPLSVQLEDGNQVVRTILSIDEETGSMTFAGDIPEGAQVRFMRANIDRLVEASSKAASLAYRDGQFKPEWAFCVSCVGRKLVLKHRVEEEIDALKRILPKDCPTSGFYSYGELSPIRKGTPCVLQNQTMTITLFAE